MDETFSSDFRLARKHKIGLRENLNRCIKADEILKLTTFKVTIKNILEQLKLTEAAAAGENLKPSRPAGTCR